MTEVPGGDALLDKWVTDAKAKAERFQRMRAGVEQVSVTEASADGEVTVTVDAGGVVTDLRIGEKVAGLPGEQIAATIMATMRRAQGRLAERVERVMHATIGDDESAMDKVMSSYHNRFPDPEPDEPVKDHDDEDPDASVFQSGGQ